MSFAKKISETEPNLQQVGNCSRLLPQLLQGDGTLGWTHAVLGLVPMRLHHLAKSSRALLLGFHYFVYCPYSVEMTICFPKTPSLQTASPGLQSPQLHKDIRRGLGIAGFCDLEKYLGSTEDGLVFRST